MKQEKRTCALHTVMIRIGSASPAVISHLITIRTNPAFLPAVTAAVNGRAAPLGTTIPSFA
jgi:hypothetical protein